MYEAKIESRGTALVILNVGARWGGKSRQAPAALTPGMTQYPLYRRLGSSLDRSGRVWWGHNVLPPQCFEPQTVRPVAGRHTACVLPAPTLTGEEFWSNKLANACSNKQLSCACSLIYNSNITTRYTGNKVYWTHQIRRATCLTYLHSVWNIFRSRKYLDNYTQEARKTARSYSCEVPITVARYNQDWNVPTIFTTVRNIKLNKNPFIRSRFDPRGETAIHTEMAKVIDGT
jgi:hypothetical protein